MMKAEDAMVVATPMETIMMKTTIDDTDDDAADADVAGEAGSSTGFRLNSGRGSAWKRKVPGRVLAGRRTPGTGSACRGDILSRVLPGNAGFLNEVCLETDSPPLSRTWFGLILGLRA